MAMRIIILRNERNLQLFKTKIKSRILKKVIISSVQKKLTIELCITQICVLKACHMICIKKENTFLNLNQII